MTDPENAWYLFVTHGDVAYTRTVKGLDAVEEQIAGALYMTPQDMPADERASWREWLRDFDGNWTQSGYGQNAMPWAASESFEDGGISIQRLSEDDPIWERLERLDRLQPAAVR